MDKITQVFNNAKIEGKKVFIPFITAGDPDMETTKRLCLILQKNGADIIELGVPFSDPLADGPVIQRASQRSLLNGTSLKKICECVKEIKNQINIPIALMSYYNPILRHGLVVSMKLMGDAGVDGLICPDLPPEEAEELIAIAKRYNIAVIFFLAPTSTQNRIALVSEKASGFIYYVSVTGVTGARDTLPTTIRDHLQQIRQITNMPIAVGFGVSTPEQASEIATWADGVIVGSAIIKILEGHDFTEDAVNRVGIFVRTIKNAINKRA